MRGRREGEEGEEKAQQKDEGESDDDEEKEKGGEEKEGQRGMEQEEGSYCCEYSSAQGEAVRFATLYNSSSNRRYSEWTEGTKDARLRGYISHLYALCIDVLCVYIHFVGILYTHKCTCIYAFILLPPMYIHTLTHTYIYIYIYTHTYIYIYIYI
jgi:hypothetical protein